MGDRAAESLGPRGRDEPTEGGSICASLQCVLMSTPGSRATVLESSSAMDGTWGRPRACTNAIANTAGRRRRHEFGPTAVVCRQGWAFCVSWSVVPPCTVTAVSDPFSFLRDQIRSKAPPLSTLEFPHPKH
eukprot:1233400-Prymnesium_polylepis.1